MRIFPHDRLPDYLRGTWIESLHEYQTDFSPGYKLKKKDLQAGAWDEWVQLLDQWLRYSTPYKSPWLIQGLAEKAFNADAISSLMSIVKFDGHPHRAAIEWQDCMGDVGVYAGVGWDHTSKEGLLTGWVRRGVRSVVAKGADPAWSDNLRQWCARDINIWNLILLQHYVCANDYCTKFVDAPFLSLHPAVEINDNVLAGMLYILDQPPDHLLPYQKKCIHDMSAHHSQWWEQVKHIHALDASLSSFPDGALHEGRARAIRVPGLDVKSSGTPQSLERVLRIKTLINSAASAPVVEQFNLSSLQLD